MRKLNLILSLIKKGFLSPVNYAKSLGVEVGEDCEFFDVTWSSEPFLISIGNNCQITNGVKFFTHGGSKILRIEIPEFDCFGKVVVKDNVYIGNNSLIMPGVIIGNNVLIAAGSVVVNSIPDDVCVAGNPARIICSIEDFKKRNLKYNLNTKGISKKKKKAFLLKTNPDKFLQKDFLKNTLYKPL